MDSASSNYLFNAAPGRRYRWHAAGNGQPTARSRQWGVHCNETLTAPGHERRDVMLALLEPATTVETLLFTGLAD